jgi:hypothetical protein
MQEGGSHILQYEGKRNWRDRWLSNVYKNKPEIAVKKNGLK